MFTHLPPPFFSSLPHFRSVAQDVTQRLAAFGYTQQIEISLDLLSKNIILGLVRAVCAVGCPLPYVEFVCLSFEVRQSFRSLLPV